MPAKPIQPPTAPSPSAGSRPAQDPPPPLGGRFPQDGGGVASAPGRICLVGEHNDWAGGFALTVPMDRAIHVERTPGPFSVSSWFEGRERTWNGAGDPGIFSLVASVFATLQVPLSGRLRITGDLPAGRGFSSSAAVCVAVARVVRPGIAAPEAAEIAYLAERATGSACGRMDPLACAWAVPLALRFHGETVLSEPVSGRCALAVGVFPTARDTRGILNVLSKHHAGDVSLRDWGALARVGAVRGALEGFSAQARHATTALRDHDLRALGGAMDTCQEIYEEELVPEFPELRAPGLLRAVRSLRANGALGAKFTGAGGEGSVIGLYPPGCSQDGVRALDALGLQAFTVEISAAV